MVECVSATRLTRLLVKEAVTSVKSAVSCNSQAEGIMESEHVTSHHRLNVMVGHAIHMLRTIGAKMKGLFRFRFRKDKRAMETSTDGQKGDDVNEEKSHESSGPSKTSVTGSTHSKASEVNYTLFQTSGSGSTHSKTSVARPYQTSETGSTHSKTSEVYYNLFQTSGSGSTLSKTSVARPYQTSETGSTHSKTPEVYYNLFPTSGSESTLSKTSVARPYQTSETGSTHSKTPEVYYNLFQTSGTGSTHSKTPEVYYNLFPTSGSESTLSNSSGLEDSIGSDTSRMVKGILTKEFFKITEPLMDTMTKGESDLLRADTVVEIAELTRLIVREYLGAKSSSTLTTEEVEAEIKLGEKIKCGNIKAFLTRRVAKLTIHRMLSGLKKTFCPGARASSLISMRAFDIDIEELLMRKGDVNQRMKKISLGKDHVFEMDLKELLYAHTTREMKIPESTPGVTEILVAPSPEAVKSAITRQVRRFLGVFGWFVNNEAVTQTERMISAFEEIEVRPIITEEAPVSVSLKAKMNVKVLVQKLITRLFKNAKVNHNVGNSVGIVESLLEKVWAKVEGESFTVTPDTFRTLDKVVYKDLVRIWGSAESVLVMFNMAGSSDENCVASIIKARLMRQPKKRRAVCKFFHSVGKAISKPFRRSSEPVGVL
ncbi:hypothetical protein CgunFtcFv8_027442 [Champsocephalus gunnari]|uniref:Uncharacterized protein n=1 Tax=Champsocephalus gunnari TaxID=52237 RepID=A0AAN8HWT0_CHAGU|nr:hypothetical protein CgunFtcFv8_027442 [Champsocephalus gunnari]